MNLPAISYLIRKLEVSGSIHVDHKIIALPESGLLTRLSLAVQTLRVIQHFVFLVGVDIFGGAAKWPCSGNRLMIIMGTRTLLLIKGKLRTHNAILCLLNIIVFLEFIMHIVWQCSGGMWWSSFWKIILLELPVLSTDNILGTNCVIKEVMTRSIHTVRLSETEWIGIYLL